MNHTSSNPLQRAKSSRGMNGCSRLWFWSAKALWHLEGFRREHTDTKDKVACKVDTFTEFPMLVAPSLFEGTISDARFGATVSPLPSHAKLQSLAGLFPYPFLKILC